MRSGWLVDGQKQPKPAEVRINLLDGSGLDLLMLPLPLVYEYWTFAPWYECNGEWIDTVLGDL